MGKVGLCTIAFSDRPLREVLDLAKEVGFDGVEIWGKEPHMGEIFEEERVRKARKMLDEKNLSVSMFGSYLHLGVEGEVLKADSTLQISQGLGTSIVRVWAGNKGSQEATEDNWGNCLRDLEKACKKAEKMGITLAIEMHTNTLAYKGESAKKLIQKVSLPNLKLNFQVSFSPDSEDPYERLETVIPWIVNVHAQNRKEVSGEWERSLIGEGFVDYRRISRRLKETDFNGYFEVEFVKGDSQEEKRSSLRKDCGFLRNLLFDA